MNAFKPLKTEWEYIIRITKILTLSLVSILLVRILFIDVSAVSRKSMEPTLKEHDLLIIEKLSNIFKPYQRGDIVQTFNPKDRSMLVKRVAGLPGETVYNSDSEITVKTKAGKTIVLRNLLQTEIVPYFTPQVLGDNEYFLLGDNRHNSVDSRILGPFHRSEIIGRVWYIWSN